MILIVINYLVANQVKSRLIIYLMVLLCWGVNLSAQDNEDHISEQERLWLIDRINENMDSLGLSGFLRKVPIKSLTWPLKQNSSYEDPGYYAISNFVDLDRSSGSVRDYNCGSRTYDGHTGTDIFLTPFDWKMMDDQSVMVVAALEGTIIDKWDGEYDRYCSFGASRKANYVVILHADGSKTLYWHLKKGSVTEKVIGSPINVGEFLGYVGSSGNSTGPHLHFELWDETNRVIDPFTGYCNNIGSRWKDQEPYTNTQLLKISTHEYLVNWNTSQCGTVQQTKEKNYFNSEDLVVFYYFGRDLVSGQTIYNRIYQPNGNLYQTKNISINNNNISSGGYWGFYLPIAAPSGKWRYEAELLGKTITHDFYVNSSNLSFSSKGLLQLSDKFIVSNLLVKNEGTMTFNNVPIDFVLSKDSVIDNQDLRLKTHTISSLQGNSQLELNLSMEYPGDMTNGTYYMLTVIDPNGQTGELNPKDNQILVGDLKIVKDCKVPNSHDYNAAANIPSTECANCLDGIKNGDELNIDCGGKLCGPCLKNIDLIISNQGYAFVGQNYISVGNLRITNRGNYTSVVTKLKFYLSKNLDWDVNDIEIGSENIISLLPGSFISTGYTIQMPKNIQEGQYFIILKLDDPNINDEIDELNNNVSYNEIVKVGCGSPESHNYVANVNVSSEECMTCNDSIKNGDEVMVDCGGTKCLPCHKNDLYFVGTPSLIINEDSIYVEELVIGNLGQTITQGVDLQFKVHNLSNQTDEIILGELKLDNLSSNTSYTLNNTFAISQLSNMKSGIDYSLSVEIDFNYKIKEENEQNNIVFNQNHLIRKGCLDVAAHNFESRANITDLCATCNDGVKNGDEIEADCGGKKCDPCSGMADLKCSRVGTVTVYNNKFTIVGMQVQNRGTGIADSSIIGFYLSKDNTIDSMDVLVKTEKLKSLIEYETKTINSVFELSKIPMNGNYYVLAMYDFDHKIKELDESNNICVFSKIVMIGCATQNSHNYIPDADITSAECENCNDGIKNGDEQDIDCGGVFCTPCICGQVFDIDKPIAELVEENKPSGILVEKSLDGLGFRSLTQQSVIQQLNFSNEVVEINPYDQARFMSLHRQFTNIYQDTLYSNCLNINTLKNPALSLQYIAINQASLRIEISIDQGKSWRTISENYANDSSERWQKLSFSLNSYKQGNFRFRIVGDVSGSTAAVVAIDNISFESIDCPKELTMIDIKQFDKNGSYFAENIATNGKILKGQNIKLSGSNCIELMPNFEVEYGAELYIDTQGCNDGNN